MYISPNFLIALAVSSCQDFAGAYKLYQEKFSSDLTLENFTKKILFYRENLNNLAFNNKPENTLKDLRFQLGLNNLDGFIFSTTDEYINEYVPLRAKRLKYLTNFDPSLGLCIVLKDKGAIFVDGRYKTQAHNEVNQNLYAIEDYTLTNITQWFKNNFSANYRIGINIKTTSLTQLQFYQKICQENNITLVEITEHLVDNIWSNQPLTPLSPVKIHPLKYCGQNSVEKINSLSETLVINNIDNYLITALDSIAWLLNIRGNDIECNPVILSKLIITKNKKVFWFVNPNKLSQKIIKELLPHVTFMAEENLEEFFKSSKSIIKWGLDQASPAYYSVLLNNLKKSLTYLKDPCQAAKSIKNKVEIKGMQEAHLLDGIAITKLLYQLYTNKNFSWNELNIDEALNNLRNKNKFYTGLPSFPSIVGVNDNGAIIHYRATPQTNQKLDYSGYLLLDCGGQYYMGTTDITRALSFNKVSDNYKKEYTLVLKGHINLASAVFKKGTTGKELDLLARAPLKAASLDYAHGTGHGVGCYLCVHEGPISISSSADMALQENNIISNEPGFYKEGAYGIRLENLYVITEHSKEFLKFHNLTLVPFDCKNIARSLLQPAEIDWLNNYHKEVINQLSPYLTTKELQWLKDYIIFL